MSTARPTIARDTTPFAALAWRYGMAVDDLERHARRARIDRDDQRVLEAALLANCTRQRERGHRGDHAVARGELASELVTVAKSRAIARAHAYVPPAEHDA